MSEDESDLIQLKYGKWRFPDIMSCPVISCGKQFGSRHDAMVHYKQQHAMHAILCHICKPNKPIRIDAHKNGFIAHFRGIHPNHIIPYGLGKTTANVSSKIFRNGHKIKANFVRNEYLVSNS